MHGNSLQPPVKHCWCPVYGWRDWGLGVLSELSKFTASKWEKPSPGAVGSGSTPCCLFFIGGTREWGVCKDLHPAPESDEFGQRLQGKEESRNRAGGGGGGGWEALPGVAFPTAGAVLLLPLRSQTFLLLKDSPLFLVSTPLPQVRQAAEQQGLRESSDSWAWSLTVSRW